MAAHDLIGAIALDPLRPGFQLATRPCGSSMKMA
jgi:hypothetical protein